MTTVRSDIPLMFEEQPDWIVLLRPDGELIWCNRAARAVLELGDDSAAVSGSLPALVAEAEQTAWRRAVAQAAAGHSAAIDVELLGAKGRRSPMELRLGPWRGETGAVVAVLGIGRSSLAGSEIVERFRVLAESSLTGMYLIQDGKFRYVNAAVASMFGYGVDELIDRLGPEEITHPEDRAAVAANIRRRIEGSALEIQYEFRGCRKDGAVIHAEVRGRRVSHHGRPAVAGTLVDVTERKAAQDALRRSEEHLKALIESIEGIVWEAEPESLRFTFVSPRAERLLGYPLANWMAEPTFWIDHLHPDDREETVRRCRDCTRERRGHEFEYRMIAADGRPVWLRDIVTVVTEKGAVVALRGIMVDVTEQKQAERRIRILNRIHAVLSEIGQLIVRERDIDALCDGAARIAVAKGGFLLAWLTLSPPGTARLQVNALATSCADAGEIRALLNRLLATPESACPHSMHALTTGEPALCNDIEAEQPAVVWRDEALSRGLRSMVALPLVIDGRPAGIFNLYAAEPGFFDAEELRLLRELAQDIAFAIEVCRRDTERQQAMEQLRSSEERFRELAETIDDVFWIAAADHTRILYISPGYVKVWGRSVESLYEAPWSWMDAVHPDDREHVKAQLNGQTSGQYDVEYRILRPDGEVRWVRDQAFPVRDAAGLVERVVGVARDITEKRQLEERFRQAQKMEAIGQLAGGVAHDFNNILAAIRMQADLAKMNETTPPEVREGLDQIRIAAERAAELTRQLLLFGRRQVMQLRELELNEIVTNLARMLQRIIGEDIRLQLNLGATSLWFRGDAGMMDQVLMNLAVNARDAMPQGGRLLIETAEKQVDRMFADLHAGPAPGRYLSLKVSDTGTGIPPEVLPRIFEPFFTTKESGKGTGLGLATVFGIVKQHRGFIRVDNRPGFGAAFEVLLPAIDAARRPPTPVPPEPRPGGGTETILLVEDESAVRLVARAVLQRHGYRVIEAANGIEALALWQKHQDEVALLLTDMVMPGGLGGQDLARRIQQAKPKIRVIYMSGYSADLAGQHLDLRHGENFLQKPFAPDELLKLLRRIFDA